MGKNYIPRKDVDFEAFFSGLDRYVHKKCSGAVPEWTHIPQAAQAELHGAYDAWYRAWSIALRPHTPVDTAAKKDVKNAGEKLIRSFVNRYLRYPPVTDGDRIAMGIPNRRGWRTHLQAPGSRPEFGLFVKDIRCIGIRFWDKERSTRAKPHGAAGALICWAILDAPPKSIKDLVFSELATRTPYFLRFDDADRGKWVYIALRWQNTKGEKGPSSGIKSTVVP